MSRPGPYFLDTVRTEDQAAEEKKRIEGELKKLAGAADFPLELRPLVALKTPDEAAQLAKGNHDGVIGGEQPTQDTLFQVCLHEFHFFSQFEKSSSEAGTSHNSRMPSLVSEAKVLPFGLKASLIAPPAYPLKLRSVRSTAWVLLVFAAGMIGLSIVILIHQHWATMSAADRASFDPTEESFAGLPILRCPLFEREALGLDQRHVGLGQHLAARGGDAGFGRVGPGEVNGGAAGVPAEENGLEPRVGRLEPADVDGLVVAEELLRPVGHRDFP